jgi:DNA-binding LacI/PurR family transcriptional regulator
MDHLIDLGHRRLGVITGNDPISGQTRLSGYRDALTKHGLDLPEEWTAILDWRFESAYTAAQRMLSAKPRPTAVAVASDYMALGVVAAATDMGLQAPRDVSVIGFDNIRLAAEVRPALTTMAQPMYEMGAEAASLLIRCITEGAPDGDQATVILPNRLVIRSSSAPPIDHT